MLNVALTDPRNVHEVYSLLLSQGCRWRRFFSKKRLSRAGLFIPRCPREICLFFSGGTRDGEARPSRERGMSKVLYKTWIWYIRFYVLGDRDYSSHRRIFADTRRVEVRSLGTPLDLLGCSLGFCFFVHLAMITIDSRVAPWTLVSYKLSEDSPPLI